MHLALLCHVGRVGSQHRGLVDVTLICVCRSASMALGRPSMISRYHQVPLPDVLGDDSTGGPVPQVTVFFNMNMRLFYILGDILGTVYGPGRGARTDDGINGDISKDIEAIETSLSSFLSTLPQAFRWENSRRHGQWEQQVLRQTNILRARSVWHIDSSIDADGRIDICI